MSSPPPQDVIVVAFGDTHSWSDDPSPSESPHSELLAPSRGRGRRRRKVARKKRLSEKSQPKVTHHDRTRSSSRIMTRRKSSILGSEESRSNENAPRKEKRAIIPESLEQPKKAPPPEEVVKKEEEEDAALHFTSSKQSHGTPPALSSSLVYIPVALFAYLADLGWVEHPTASDLQTAATKGGIKQILYNFPQRLYPCYRILTSSKFRYHSEGCKEDVELGLDYHTLVRTSKTEDDWIAYPCGSPVEWPKEPQRLRDACLCKDECCQGRLRRCPAVHCWAPFHCVDQLMEHLQQHEDEPVCVPTKGVGLILYPWRYQRALWWSIISNDE